MHTVFGGVVITAGSAISQSSRLRNGSIIGRMRNAALRNEWTEILSSDTRFEERALTLARLSDPFPAVPDFVPRARLADWNRGIEEALQRGWLERISNQSFRPTSVGLRFADSLGLLLSESE